MKFHTFIQTVIVYYNALYQISRHYTPCLDRLYSTGHGCINRRRHKSTTLRYLLSCKYTISFCHDWLSRGSDMLRHGIDHFSLRQNILDRLVFRQIFAIIGMDSTYKCQLRHFLSSFLNHSCISDHITIIVLFLSIFINFYQQNATAFYKIMVE